MGSLELETMGYRYLLQSLALLYFTLLPVHTQVGTVGDQGTEDCCPSITVSGLQTNQDLNGEYILKTKLNFKPEEACLNGCIYTKKDDKEEYCFKKDEESLISSECFVLQNTPTTTTTIMATTMTVSTITTSATTPPPTTAAAAETTKAIRETAITKTTTLTTP